MRNKCRRSGPILPPWLPHNSPCSLVETRKVVYTYYDRIIQVLCLRCKNPQEAFIPRARASICQIFGGIHPPTPRAPENYPDVISLWAGRNSPGDHSIFLPGGLTHVKEVICVVGDLRVSLGIVGHGGGHCPPFFTYSLSFLRGPSFFFLLIWADWKLRPISLSI